MFQKYQCAYQTEVQFDNKQTTLYNDTGFIIGSNDANQVLVKSGFFLPNNKICLTMSELRGVITYNYKLKRKLSLIFGIFSINNCVSRRNNHNYLFGSIHLFNLQLINPKSGKLLRRFYNYDDIIHIKQVDRNRHLITCDKTRHVVVSELDFLTNTFNYHDQLEYCPIFSIAQFNEEMLIFGGDNQIVKYKIHSDKAHDVRLLQGRITSILKLNETQFATTSQSIPNDQIQGNIVIWDFNSLSRLREIDTGAYTFSLRNFGDSYIFCDFLRGLCELDLKQQTTTAVFDFYQSESVHGTVALISKESQQFYHLAFQKGKTLFIHIISQNTVLQ